MDPYFSFNSYFRALPLREFKSQILSSEKPSIISIINTNILIFAYFCQVNLQYPINTFKILPVLLISLGACQGYVNIQNQLSKGEPVTVIAMDRCRTDRITEAAVFVRPQNFMGEGGM